MKSAKLNHSNSLAKLSDDITKSLNVMQAAETDRLETFDTFVKLFFTTTMASLSSLQLGEEWVLEIQKQTPTQTQTQKQSDSQFPKKMDPNSDLPISALRTFTTTCLETTLNRHKLHLQETAKSTSDLTVAIYQLATSLKLSLSSKGYTVAGFEPSTNSVGNAVANALSKVEGKRVNAAWSLGERASEAS